MGSSIQISGLNQIGTYFPKMEPSQVDIPWKFEDL